MRKLFILISIMFSFNGYIFSQASPQFNLTKDGVEPVILNFDANFTASLIYTKIKDWIAIPKKNSKTTTRIDSINSLLKVGGYIDKAWKIRDNNYEKDHDYWYGLEYTFTIDIKDTKCRVTFATPEVRYKVWFNKDGSTIAKFKESEESFEASINLLLTSLHKYVKEPAKNVKEDW